MQVSEIMTPDPATCTPETSLQDVARMMVDCDCGAIPVVGSDGSGEPAGIVTDRDIVCRAVAEGRNPLQMRAGDVMTANVLRIDQHEDVENLMRLMEKNQVRRVVVVDGKRCVGMVSQADVARHLSDDVAGELVEDISRPSHGASSPSTPRGKHTGDGHTGGGHTGNGHGS